MLINIKNIHFKRHCLFHFAKDMQAIMSPLTPMGIKHFSYERIDADQGIVNLSSNPDFEESFIRKNLYYRALRAPYQLYHTGHYLGNFIDMDREVISLLHTYDLWHYSIIIKRHTHCTELFYFGASLGFSRINHVYLNQRDIFENYIDYFKEKAALMIQRYEPERLFYPNGDDFSALVDEKLAQKICAFNERSELQFNFVQNKCISSLSKRQSECLYHILCGKSAKQISHILGLSVRTVESYIEGIKDKWGCSNKLELIEYSLKQGYLQITFPK